MKRPSYGWLLKWIIAAILLVIGFTMFFNQPFVYLTTGVGIVIFSLFRIYPLLKTLKKEVSRTIHLIEILLALIVGSLMIYVGVLAVQNELQIDAFWGQVYKYGFAFILLMRAIVFFYSTTFLDEKVEQPKFWSHVGLIIMGSMIAASESFSDEWMAWLLLLISIIGGAYLIYDGAKGYGGYRKFSEALNEKKQAKQIEKRKNIDGDAVIPEKEEDRPYIS